MNEQAHHSQISKYWRKIGLQKCENTKFWVSNERSNLNLKNLKFENIKIWESKIQEAQLLSEASSKTVLKVCKSWNIIFWGSGKLKKCELSSFNFNEQWKKYVQPQYTEEWYWNFWAISKELLKGIAQKHKYKYIFCFISK
jgi:hypothetical protein